MKYIGLFTALTLFFSVNSFAQKTEEIKVWGNCGMCKKTIEAAAIKAGAKTANWNKDSKVLNVEFKEKRRICKKSSKPLPMQDMIRKTLPLQPRLMEISLNAANIPEKVLRKIINFEVRQSSDFFMSAILKKILSFIAGLFVKKDCCK